MVFSSVATSRPAQFYLFSAPGHTTYPTVQLRIEAAAPVHLGDSLNSNKRIIYKYIHPEGVQSCQIVMGVTLLEPGNMWNTMPAHIHARRMEVYCYFDIEADNVVFHLMGEAGESRHLVMHDREVVISPSWSIHSGMGTGSYTFIRAMTGENQAFAIWTRCRWSRCDSLTAKEWERQSWLCQPRSKQSFDAPVLR